MRRITKSEIRVTGLDGVTHTGAGENMAQAARDLGERHDDRMAELDQRIETFGQRVDALAELMAAGCRHCGEPILPGQDRAICQAALELGEVPHPYAVHVACQAAVLNRMAAVSHDTVSRWTLTAAGAALLAADRP